MRLILRVGGAPFELTSFKYSQKEGFYPRSRLFASGGKEHFCNGFKVKNVYLRVDGAPTRILLPKGWCYEWITWPFPKGEGTAQITLLGDGRIPKGFKKGMEYERSAMRTRSLTISTTGTLFELEVETE